MSEVNSTPASEVSETTEEQSTDQNNEEVEASGEESAVETVPKVDELSNKEQKKVAQNLKKKFALKIDGKEVEEELDLGDDEAIKKHLQMSKASQKRMQEAAELQKAAEQFIEMLRTNPRKVLTDPNIGVDLKKLAQEIINEEIENANKSPEQLEKEKLQKELEELKEKYKKDEEERKSKDFSRLQAEQEEKIQSDIESALNSNELPKTPYTVRKMAEMMMIALENNIDLSPKDLVPLIRRQMNSDIKELFSSSSDDVLEELLGKDNITRIRKRNLQKIKQIKEVAQTAGSVKQTGADAKKTEKKPEKKLTIKEFLKI